MLAIRLWMDGLNLNVILVFLPIWNLTVWSAGCDVRISSNHYSDVIMSVMASQITGISIVYLSFCSGVDIRKHQSSVSLAIVRGIHRWPVNYPHKGPVTRKMFPFYDVSMCTGSLITDSFCLVNQLAHFMCSFNIVHMISRKRHIQYIFKIKFTQRNNGIFSHPCISKHIDDSFIIFPNARKRPVNTIR